MKKRFFAVFSALVFLTSVINAQPISQVGTGVNSSLVSVYFYDNLTGYVGSSAGTYLKSSNGGLNWQSYNNGFDGVIEGINFINSSTGFMCGKNGIVGKTTNGGANWSLTTLPGSTWLRSIYFRNQNTGFVCGTYNSLFKTTNGGLNWTALSSGLPSTGLTYLTDIYDAGDKIFISVENAATNLIVSSNDGANWQSAKTENLGTLSAHRLSFNGQYGYVVGIEEVSGQFYGTIYSTSTKGANWNKAAISSQSILRGVAVSKTNPLTCVAVGNYINHPQYGNNPLIRRTTNGGVSWSEETCSLSSGNIDLIAAVSTSNDFLMVGSGGTMLKTSQTVGIISHNSEVPKKYTLSQNYPNPFNPTTTIKFALPKNGLVSLRVYDMNGKVVEELVSSNLGPGTYEYLFPAQGLSSGTYFYELRSNDFREVKKMTLVK